MTPLADGVTDETSTAIKYPNKIGLIENILKSRLPKATITRMGYNRLRFWTGDDGFLAGPDANIVDTSSRGQCLFQ